MKNKLLALLTAFAVFFSVTFSVAYASEPDSFATVVIDDEPVAENGLGGGVAGYVIDSLTDAALKEVGFLIVQGVKNMMDNFISIDTYLKKPNSNTEFDDTFYNSDEGLAWRSNVNTYFSKGMSAVVGVVSEGVFGDILGKVVLGAYDELVDILGKQTTDELMTYDEMLRQFDNEYIKPYYRGIDDFTVGTFGILKVPNGSGSTSGAVLEKVGSGSVSFLTGFVSPLLSMCASNPVCLVFLTVTFVFLGVLMVRRFVRSFGRRR